LPNTSSKQPLQQTEQLYFPYFSYENFEEYTRRQYYAKAPSRNPFGDDEQPIKFNRLDVFQKIRVLQQLSAWTFWNPDRVRERMPEQKENEQTQWVRIPIA
jgi:hypothetical protein